MTETTSAATSSSTAEPAPASAEDTLRLHRREVRRQIAGPLLAAVLFVAALVALLIVPFDADAPLRARAVSSLLVSVLLLCPAIVVLFAIYMLLVAAVYGMSRLHGSALPPLQRLEKAAGMARQRVNGWAGRLNQQAIRWGALAAPLESLFTQLEALFKETNRDPNE